MQVREGSYLVYLSVASSPPRPQPSSHPPTLNAELRWVLCVPVSLSLCKKLRRQGFLSRFVGEDI